MFLKLMCATSLGKLCASDHAMNAIDEMSALNRPFGMWMLFAGSFQKQLTAVLGYDADTAKAIQRFKTACGMSGDLSCSLTWSLTKFF